MKITIRGAPPKYRQCPDCGEHHDVNEWPDNHQMWNEVLCRPHVISDHIPDLFHPCDNGRYESKRKFREVTKAHGREEIGNDPIKDKRWVDRISAADVAGAKQMVDQGYRPHNETATKEDSASVIATAA